MESQAKIYQTAVERFLENTSLTAELDDEAADSLIKWGIAAIKQAVFGAGAVPSQQETEDRLRIVRKMIRSVSKLAATRKEKDTEANLQALAKVWGYAETLQEKSYASISDAQRKTFLKSHEKASDQTFITALRKLLS